MYVCRNQLKLVKLISVPRVLWRLSVTLLTTRIEFESSSRLVSAVLTGYGSQPDVFFRPCSFSEITLRLTHSLLRRNEHRVLNLQRKSIKAMSSCVYAQMLEISAEHSDYVYPQQYEVYAQWSNEKQMGSFSYQQRETFHVEICTFAEGRTNI